MASPIRNVDELGDAVRQTIRAFHGSPPPWRSMVAERLAEARRDPQHALLAEHLLRHTDTSPADWRRVNEFLKDNQLTLGDTIGSGQERVVFEALPASGISSTCLRWATTPNCMTFPMWLE